MKTLLLLVVPLCLMSCTMQKGKDDGPRRLELFFLGHDSKHHDSELLAEILSQEYFPEGINITYSVDPEDLTRPDLHRFDGLILYANHDSISPAQAKGLLDYVDSGKGFIPLHSASYCFRNSPEVVALIGGQFMSHGGESFSAVVVKPDHPAMDGVESFETEWDETYVHDKLTDDIVVLMERVDSTHREPYTWVKEYGKGRVFYTAFGHDERTFRNPGFLQLVKSGIRWAVGEEAVKRLDEYAVAQPTYQEGRMPNYERRDPPPRYQLPLTPEASQSLIQVPVGFRLELFASEPDIKKPISMDWDERGRLWVIETVDYPNTVRDDKGAGDDRILICEDTNGDGKADKFTVFAEGLNIPTAFTFVNGGIVVAQAPHFLFLKDTDGDDKADVREVLIDGWGTFDTHAGPSNLRYGLDNKLWGTVGYSGFDGQIGGQPFKFGSGVYRFDTGVKHFEFLGNTSNNTWGLGFSEDFDVFISTANNEHSDFLAIPARYYERANVRERGIEKIDGHYNIHVLTKELRQVDVHHGFTAVAGHSLYTARAFPKEYWNRVAFITEPTGRLVHRHILEQVGSGFREKGDGWNVIASSDNWFGPVEAKVGPDGSLWVLDWYNFVIQHNPTPEGFENGAGNAYIDPLRDNTKGRIYRLVHEDSKPAKTYKLNREQPATLVDALKSDNQFWRLTAQRLLVETGATKVAGDLHKLVRNTEVDEIKVNGAAIHALWTLHGLGLLDGSDENSLAVALDALKHPAPGVRRAAVHTLPVQKPEVVKALLASGALQDTDLRVRVAVLLALADAAPTAETGKAIAEAGKQPENVADKWVSHALLIAGAVHRQVGEPGATGVVNEAAALVADETKIIKVIVGEMKYDVNRFTAKAGTILKIVFENPDHMQHNLLILKPGTLEKVGAAADALAKQPNGGDLQYIPKTADVLFSTPLVNPEDRVELTFRVPESPGDYPYVCTFPGHWRIMHGVMNVVR